AKGASAPHYSSWIVAGVFRKNAPKMIFVEHDHVVRTFAPRRTDQALNKAVLPGRAEGRWPIPNTHSSDASFEQAPNARSLSRMRYFGAVSHGNASVIWRASHSAVGLRVTANHNNCRRLWPRTRHAKSC